MRNAFLTATLLAAASVVVAQVHARGTAAAVELVDDNDADLVQRALEAWPLRTRGAADLDTATLAKAMAPTQISTLNAPSPQAMAEEYYPDQDVVADDDARRPSALDLLLHLRGGGKKRKKKVFTKPKKKKHVRKKEKMSILKNYKVQEDGTVQRLRPFSPDAPGCFMAKHHDRYYCGRTGQSYPLEEVSKAPAPAPAPSA